MRWPLFLLSGLCAAHAASAQTITTWRTSGELPVVIVQMPGGDVEHLAAVVPADAELPSRLGGEPTQVTPRRLAQVVAVKSSDLRLGPVVSELLTALRACGAAVLVAIGPRPARDLETLLAGAEDVNWRPLPRQRCARVDGGLEAWAGSPERIELALGLPDLSDPRLALAPSLALWIEQAVRGGLPGTRAELDVAAGCARLMVRAPAGELAPREALARLRTDLAGLAGRQPGGEELAAVRAAAAARRGRLAVDLAPVARDLAEWTALGGQGATVLAAGEIDGPALAAFGREVLAGHSGWATVVETERRARPPSRESLDNGAMLSVSWLPGDLGVVAVALGGLSPRAGVGILDGVAAAAARQGWATQRAELLGVPVLALAVPTEAVSDALELVTGEVRERSGPAEEGVWADARGVFGLSTVPDAAAVSLAAVLPLDAEEGAEAARKFLSSLPPGGVRVETSGATERLHWIAGEGRPAILAFADLEPSPRGVLAALVLQDRATEGGMELTFLAPSGRLVVALAASGEAHIPALDARLAKLWPQMVRPVTGREMEHVVARACSLLLGDLALAVAREAARPFLPTPLDERTLRAVTDGDATRALAALSPWTELLRFARGPSPPPQTPARGVRQSPPGAPAGG